MGTHWDLGDRTAEFALCVVRMYCSLPKTTVAQVLGKQVLRSGTSVGAHYCEAKRARTRKEFASKMRGGLAELEETIYWLNLLAKGGVVDRNHLRPLIDESEELIRIFVACVKTAKSEQANDSASSNESNQ